MQAGGAKPKRKRSKSGQVQVPEDPSVKALVGRAEQIFGTPVEISRNPADGKGMVSVRFYSDDDLIRILKIMGVDTELA